MKIQGIRRSRLVLFITLTLAVLWASWRPHKLLGVAAILSLGLLLATALAHAGGMARLIITLLSVVFSLWGAEAIVAFSMPSSSRARIAARQGVAYDRRAALDVVLELRRQGIDAIGNMRPWPPTDGAALVPLGGAPNRETVLCNEAGAYVTYHSDEYGFNNPRSVWSAQGTRLTLVGDSFTHGACVPSEQNIAGRLRERYPATLNLGWMGNGPLADLAVMREYVEPLKPPIVFWLHYEGNDVTDLNLEAHAKWPLSYLDPAFRQGLMSRTSEIDQLYRKLGSQERLEAARADRSTGPPHVLTLDAVEQRFGVDSPIIDFVQHLMLSEIRMKLSDLRDQWQRQAKQRSAGFGMNRELFEAVLRLANDTIRQWNGRLIVVYLPDWAAYDSPTRPDFHRADVLQVCERLGIPVIDIDPVFRAHPDPLSLFPLRQRGHYTAEGYQLVAQTLMSAVEADSFNAKRLDLPRAEGL